MNRLLPVFLLATWLAFVRLHGASLINPDDSIAICGDSITEQRIYSVFMEDYLLMCQPTQGQKVVQLGWSGEQAPGFQARLDTDLFPFKPTVVTTCYGMNDGHYAALTPDAADTYRKSQTAIVESLKQHGVRVIVLGSSKCVDTYYFRNDPAQAATYNKTLGSLADIDRDIAIKENVVYADVFGATTAAMEKAKALYGEKYDFGGGDGIHPGPNGHLVMAYAFLKALGCDGAIGTITVDPDLHRADGSPGQKIVSYDNGTVQVESTRYPFCFQGSPDDTSSQNDAAVLKAVPFNQDLNRYMLVVQGLTTSKAKVTWGTQSKEFTSDQLKAGINLADQFPTNPFTDAFTKVDAAVQAQQAFETGLIKNLLHNLPSYKQMAPKQTAALDAVATDAIDQSRELFKTAAALVTPVDFTLKIELEP